MAWKVPPPHNLPEPEVTPTLEVLEAKARQAIAAAAAIQVRGWNGRREKDAAIARADAAIEAYNFARDVANDLDALAEEA